MNSKSVKKILAILSIALLGVAAGCGSSGSGEKKAEAPKAAGKKIIVATRGTAKPFTYTDDKGNLTGYDVELLKAVQKKDPSLQFEFKAMGVDAAFVAMKSKQVDAIANQMRRNPQRVKNYLYTNEVNNYTARKLVVKDNRTDINSFEDLNGKKVAVTSNSEFNDMVKEFNKTHKPGIEPIYSDKGSAENLNLVATGRADAAGEYAYVVDVARKDRKLPIKTVGPTLQSVPTYFIFRKDPAFEEVIKKIDKAMKALREDGTLKKLSEKFLGGDYTVKQK